MWHFGTWFSLGLGSARLPTGLDDLQGLFQLNDSKCRGTFSLLEAYHVSGKIPDQNAKHPAPLLDPNYPSGAEAPSRAAPTACLHLLISTSHLF